MNAIEVKHQPVSINAGVVRLSAAQAKVRAHAVKLVKGEKDGGIYEVTAQVQFKVGERFGFNGRLGKNGQLVVDAPRAEAVQEQ
jgi:hypothetical protein